MSRYSDLVIAIISSGKNYAYLQALASSVPPKCIEDATTFMHQVVCLESQAILDMADRLEEGIRNRESPYQSPTRNTLVK